jgi:carboxymethylenebutenolidase
MAGEFIQIRATDGFSFRAYRALPTGGTGPGLIVQQELFGVNSQIRSFCDQFAAEGYVVVAPDLFARIERDVELGYGESDIKTALSLYQNFDEELALRDIGDTLAALRRAPECTGKIGTLGYCLGGKLAMLTAARCAVDCAVSYYGVGIENCLEEAGKIKCPMIFHFAELDHYAPAAVVSTIRARFTGRNDIKLHVYPGVDHGFAAQERSSSFNKPAAMIAYSRSLGLLRKSLGPDYDLSALWDKHMEHEFATRDLEANMKTMVAEPYVNDVPTLTGGVGHNELRNFYKNHFLFANPADTRAIPISRTVGTDRIVDEVIFCFTHDREIDWMLPGVPPTGKYVEVPLVAIVCFRGDKLYHEHIYWDQASVLVQLGLLVLGGLPVVGIESAQKLVNENLPSNLLIKNCLFRRLDAHPFPSDGGGSA